MVEQRRGGFIPGGVADPIDALRRGGTSVRMQHITAWVAVLAFGVAIVAVIVVAIMDKLRK